MVCVECGTALRATRKPNLAGTMLGMPTPFAAPQGEPSEGPVPKAPEAEGRTEVPNNRAALGGTMIGMPSPLAPEHRQSPVYTTPADPEAARPQGNPALGKTMMGVGNLDVGAGSTQPNSPQDQKFKGTLLGIARPGIAPTGEAPRPPTPPVTRSAPARPPSPSTAPRISSIPVPQPFPTTRPRWVNGLLIAGGLAIAAGIGAGVAMCGPKTITVRVDKFSINEAGNDQLDLICEKCPAGSSLILGDAHAKVQNGRAKLTPKEPLALGRNELQFRLEDRGNVRKTKKVILPIAFRVLTRWSGLHEAKPYAEITVAASSGSKVIIGAEPTALQGEQATKRVYFEAETLGEASQMTSVQRELAIEVTVNGEPRKTRAEIRSGVTPLTLTSPALVHHLKGKPVSVSGRTAPNAKVTILEAQLEANENGDFSYVLESPQAGTITVTAYKEDLLRRRVSFELSANAPDPPQAVTSYTDIKAGVSVNISGNVLESRTVDGTTRALMEIERGCSSPPCLLRVVYAEPTKLAPNRVVRITGVVSGGDPPTVRVSRFR